MFEIEEASQSRMRTERYLWWCVEVHPREVENAIESLKLQKSNGPDGVQPEHLRHGGSYLCIHLSVALFLHTRSYRTNFLNHTLYPLSKTNMGT